LADPRGSEMSGWSEFCGIVVRLFTPPVKYVWAAVSSVVLGYWVGAPDGLKTVCEAALAVWFIDTITGTLLAIRDKKYSSRAFGRSLSKIVVYGCAIGVSVPLGCVFTSVPGVGEAAPGAAYAVTYIVCMLVFIREASSTLENLACMGFPMPAFITERLAKLNDMCNTGKTDKETTDNEQ